MIKRLAASTLISAALSVALAASPARAFALDYATVCNSPSPTASGAPVTPALSTDLATQKQQYCQAAKSAQDGAKVDGVLWKVWAGVAGVCTAACATNWVGGQVWNHWYCDGVNLAGGATDALMTKQFGSLLTSILSTGAAMLTNKMMNTTTSELASTGGPVKAAKNYGACLTAASAAMQAFSKQSSESSQSSSADQNLQQAAALASQAPNVNSGATAPTLGSNATGGSTGAGTTGSNLAQQTGGTSSRVIPSSCSGGDASVQGMVQCAVASDQTLPDFVKRSGFPSEFKKASGFELGELFSKKDAASALHAAMSGPMSSEQSARLGAALQQLKEKAPIGGAPESLYASGGGSPAAGGQGDNMGDMMNNLSGMMEQLMPKTAGAEQMPQTGVGAVAFAYQRGPASEVAHDRTVSIFDRVTYRYYFVRGRVLSVGGTP